MPHPLPIHTSVITRGDNYKICWSTEASQQVLALRDEDLRKGVKHPITYPDIISAIRISPNDSERVHAEIGTADLGLFLVKNHYGVAYEVLVSYHPATAHGGTNVCEIYGVAVCTEAELLATLP